MISKLKKQFILLATSSIVALMLLLILIMNLVNYNSVIRESDQVLDFLSRANNFFQDEVAPPEMPRKDFTEMLPRGMSPEVPYESRFFTVSVSPDGIIKDAELSNIISVDRNTVAEYVKSALKKNGEKGFVGNFRFSKVYGSDRIQLVFLDCGRKLDSFKNFMLTSLLVGLSGCLIAFFFLLFASGKILYPVAESYEKQKRFITDAGHEIKTPLTIISANTDLLEADFGENESISDIRFQTGRLAKLTNDLVYLSKMEENAVALPKIDFPLSDLVLETASSFQALALSKEKDYTVSIAPAVTLNGSPEDIRRLVSILIDNAMKYSPNGGKVSLNLSAQKKNCVITVANTTDEQLDKETVSHLFDRFYRSDSSRNSELGGHGIGLSIAKAIVEKQNGKIFASADGVNEFKITVSIPLG